MWKRRRLKGNDTSIQVHKMLLQNQKIVFFPYFFHQEATMGRIISIGVKLWGKKSRLDREK